MSVLAMSWACIGVTACGGGGKSSATSTTAAGDSSTTTDASASSDTTTTIGDAASSATGTAVLTVSPTKGAIGTTFKFVAAGFRPGTQLAFHVTRPNKSTFVGPSHSVAANGTISAVYGVTAPNPIGMYTVDAIDADGTKATATFVVSGATTTTINHTVTTRHP